MHGELEVWLLAVVSVWTRLFGATLGIPAFTYYRVPRLFMNLLLLGLALPMASLNMQHPAAFSAISNQPIVLILATELITGLVLGFGLMAAFAAIEAFGQLLDAQSGLSIAQLFGFTQRRPQPIISALLTTTAICVFFAANMHHDFLSAVATWYRIAPPDYVLDQLEHPIDFAIQLHRSFSMGILMAMPIAALLLLGDVILAFASRSMPQLNVIFLSFPIKLLMTLFGLVATSHLMTPILLRMFEQIGLAPLAG